MDEGRINFPSTETESLVDRLRLNLSRPITSHQQNETIKSYGDIRLSNPNKPVEGGLILSNLQVNGPIRTPNVIHTKPKIMTKYENKRQDTQVTEAVYDWRSQKSKSGYEYNYLSNQLDKRAKSKVFNKPMYNYMTQPNRIDSKDLGTSGGIPITQSFNNVEIGGSVQNFEDRMVGLDRKDTFQNNFEEGTLKITPNNNALGFGGLLTQQYKTNPLLNGNFTGKSLLTGLQKSEQGNQPYRTINDNSVNFSTVYPDERMTRYSGERPYVTNGDRNLIARNLATSKENQEKRDLQNSAYQSLNGLSRAPRKNVANISQGINDDYQDVSVIQNTNEKYSVNTSGRKPTSESYMSRNTLTNSSVLTQPRYSDNDRVNNNGFINPVYNRKVDRVDELTTVQPHSKIYQEQIFEDVGNKVFNDNLQRKLQEDDDSRLFQNSTIENYTMKDRTKISNNNINDKTKQEVDKRELTFSQKIFEGFKSFFGISPKKREDFEKRLEQNDETLVENIVLQKQLEQNKRIFETPNGIKFGYWVVEDNKVKNIKENFENNTKHSQVLETKPIGILISDKDKSTISLTKIADRIKILEKIEDQDGTRYVTINIPKEQFEKLLDHPVRLVDKTKQSNLTDLKNIQEDICELNFEDFVKVKSLVDQTPGILKLISKESFTEYQRILLDEVNLPIITNSKKIAEEKIMENEFVKRNKTENSSTNRIDLNSQQVDRFKTKPVIDKFVNQTRNNHVVENGNGLRISNNPTTISISKNNNKIMKQFNSMM